jgi:hypothetical protein
MERVKGIEPSTTAWKAVVLPLNYTRITELKWWFGAESNRRHMDFQSIALPTELPNRKDICFNGGPDGTRTRDLLRDRQAF